MILELKETDQLQLSLVKNHLNVEHNLDDILITQYTNTSLVSTEIQLRFPITSETYSSTIKDQYYIKYKPNTITIFLANIEVGTITDFAYNFPYLNFNTDIEYDEVIVDVLGKNSDLITSSRLLDIGSWYLNRENEVYNNKTQSQSSQFLLDLAAESFI